MSLDEFIEKLEGTKGRHWFVSAFKRLRAPADDVGTCCPITMIHPSHWEPGLWRAAAKDLGIEAIDALAIISAADDDEECNAALRGRLLTAVGLTP